MFDVCAYGMGVNSVAMLIGFRQRGIRPSGIWASDTRGEKPETYEHVDKYIQPWLRQTGQEVEWICRADFKDRTKVGDDSLEAECLRLGTLPSRAYGYGTCADKWKIDPFKWRCDSLPEVQALWAAGGTVVRYIGYDAGETRRVTADGDKGYTKVFPLIEWGWDRERCIWEIKREGIPVPPKSACFYCPSSRKTEVIQLGRRHPQLMARSLRIEDNAIAKGISVKGLGRRFSWRELMEASEAQQEMFAEAPVESCSVCVYESDDEAA